MTDRSFFDAFLVGVTTAVIFYTTSYLIDKTIKHSGKIKELSSRLKECEEKHESSQDHELKKWSFQYTMSDNKLVKTILDAATLTGIAAGIGWVSKKALKENLTSDPSSNIMNYVKFTAVMAGAIAAKKYLEDQKILPVWKNALSIKWPALR